MVPYIKQLFDVLLGVSLPDVAITIITLAIVAVFVRQFIKTFHLDGKLFTYSIYIVIALLALSSLGGFSWSLSL